MGSVKAGWVEGTGGRMSCVRLACGLSQGDQGGPCCWAPGVRDVEMRVQSVVWLREVC